jgi:hypothetical protein
LTLDECSDRGSLVFADDQVTLPVTWFRTIVRRKRAVVDREHRLLEPGPASISALLRASTVTTRP